MVLPLTKAAGRTHVGLKRETNEDSYFSDEQLGLHMVADGVGGHPAGDVASRLAVEVISKGFREWIESETPVEGLLGPSDPSLSRAGNYVLASIRLANRLIHEKAGLYEEYHDMGTTVAVLSVRPGLIIAANVGDSRIYLVHDGQIERLTKDHTVVAEQVELGILKSEEADDSPLKHVVTRTLGSAEEIEVEISERTLSGNERFILCTDGLTDLVSDEDILHMASAEGNPGALCENLISTALKRGGHDNTTVVSVYVSPIGKPFFAPVRKIGSFLAGIFPRGRRG